MVSVEQLTALISFIENHEEMALGLCSRSKEGRSQMRRLWVECAEILNSISSDCISKTADRWRLYFNEYKSKLIKKIKAEKALKTATRGGPAKRIILTPIQERLYSIIGRDVGDPLPGVRHNPLSEQSQVTEYVGTEVVWDDTQIVNDHLELVTNEPFEPQPGPSSEPQPGPSSEPQPRLLSEQQPPLQPRLFSEPDQAPTSRAPRRRRPRSRRADTESAFQEAQETLLAAENISSQALREHAFAIDRHAAAIERLAAAIEAIADSSTNERPSFTRRHQSIESESD